MVVAVCLTLLVFYRRTPSVGQWDKLPPAEGPSEPVEEKPSPPASMGADQPTLSPPEPHQEE